ncbi:MAG: hypothetical protein ACPHER_02460 [Nevskiales bacterium]
MFTSKTKKQISTLIASLFIVLAVSACSDDDDDGGSNSGNNNNSAPHNTAPAARTFALDESRQASAVATPDTETRLSVANADGVVGELVIPAGSVSQDTEITITAVESLPEFGNGEVPVAAFHFGPEGLYFPNGVTLTLEIPNAPDGPIVAFIYRGEAEAFEPIAFIRNGNIFTTTLAHFSGAGFVSGEYDEFAHPSPAGVDQAQQEVTLALNTDPLDVEKLKLAMHAFAEEIRDLFDSVEDDHSNRLLHRYLLNVANNAWFIWRSGHEFARQLGLEQEDLAELELLSDELTEYAVNAWLLRFEKLYDQCVQTQDMVYVRDWFLLIDDVLNNTLGVIDERLDPLLLAFGSCLSITFDKATIPSSVGNSETVDVEIIATLRFGDSAATSAGPHIKLMLESNNKLGTKQRNINSGDLFTTTASLQRSDNEGKLDSINITAYANLLDPDKSIAGAIGNAVSLHSDGSVVLELTGKDASGLVSDPVEIDEGEALMLQVGLYKGGLGLSNREIVFKRESSNETIAAATTDGSGKASVSYSYPIDECGEDTITAEVVAGGDINNPSDSIEVEFECANNRPPPWLSSYEMECTARAEEERGESEKENHYSNASDWEPPTNEQVSSNATANEGSVVSSADCTGTLDATYSPESGKITTSLNLSGSSSASASDSDSGFSASVNQNRVIIHLPGSNYNYSLQGTMNAMSSGHPDGVGACTVEFREADEELSIEHDSREHSGSISYSGLIANDSAVILDADCISRSPADSVGGNSSGSYTLTITLDLTPN